MNALTRRNFMRTASTSLLAAALPATTQLAPPDKQPPELDLPRTRRKLGWAIVGLGELALGEILPAFGECERSRPVALVSGHRDKAQKVARHYDINEKSIYSYDDYDRIVEDDAIDIVYNVLPNHMHAEFTIRALKAKKHVLCEKPMAATSEEARQMIAAAKENDRKLMIAYRLHYEPNHMRAIELVRSGAIGKPKLFHALNCQDVQPPNIRLSKQTAGGPVGDVGVYCFNAARYILGEEPVEVSAFKHQPKDDPRFAEVAESVGWTMRFPSGAIDNSTCSFGTAQSRWMRVVGDKGFLEIDNAFGYFGQQLKVNDGQSTRQVTIRPKNHFQAEMDHFSQCVAENTTPRTPGEEGLQDMIIQEAILKSAEEGKPVKVDRAMNEPVDPYVKEPTTQKAKVEAD